MMDFIGSHVREQWRIVVVTEGPGPAQRLAELFHDNDIPCARVDSLDDDPQAGLIEVTTAAVGRGFVLEPLKLALLTEADLLGRTSAGSTKDMRRMPSKRRNAVDPLQLVAGDSVVHEQHGIGRFVELIQRKVAGGGDGVREYLVLEYAPSKRGAPGDRLFVPTDQLDQVTRYVGGDTPALSKMGGADWASTKSKARKAVKEIAGELIRLYSARMASRGYAFGPDTPWQRELEEAFPYVETPDQLTTINEVKADMEREIPMDRLISGDVGYGKTEIAVRAAFKAVQDGKQVAVLVPTTLLAQQHYETFTERFSGFPLVVKPLSRFQGGKEAKETAEGVKSRFRGRRDRHPPAAVQGLRLQGPRPGDRGRGAALRRRTQGGAEEDAHQRRRPGHERHPDSADPGDVPDRHPRNLHPGHPAGGTAPRADLRGPVHGQADLRRDPP